MPTLSAMFKLYDGYSATINKINRQTNDATNKILKASGVTDKFNQKLKSTGTDASTASTGLGKYISAAVLLASALKGIDVTDTYINTQARLKLINDGLQTQEELQSKIFAAADRSRGSYTDMASSVAKLGMLAGDAFGSNDETIKFTELMQKSFKLGGSSGEEQSSGMYQLTQAMAAGKLQGDEFKSITENAPMLAQAIADFTGKSKGELKEMSAEGTITADVIKGALFAAADGIEDKFSKLPMTFADYWSKIKNAAIAAFSGVMESINKMVNTNGFEDFINNLIIGIGVLAFSLQGILNILGWIFDKTSQYWDFLSPILETIGGVLLVIILNQMRAIAMAAWAAVVPWIIAHWQIVLIVAAIVLVINVLNALGISFKSIFEFIGGAISVIITLFANAAKMIANSFIAIANIINSVISGAVNLVIDGVDSIISALNKIPGVDIESVGEFKALTQIEYLKQGDYSDAYTKGSNAFGKVYDSASDKLSGLLDKFKSAASAEDTTVPTTSTDPITVQGTGSDGTVDVDMSDEDMQYLKDIAERDYINKFSSRTIAPNIQVTFGDVHETADVDKVASRMQKILQEQIAMSGEGAHA